MELVVVVIAIFGLVVEHVVLVDKVTVVEVVEQLVVVAEEDWAADAKVTLEDKQAEKINNATKQTGPNRLVRLIILGQLSINT